jgi:hypothetical protein
MMILSTNVIEILSISAMEIEMDSTTVSTSETDIDRGTCPGAKATLLWEGDGGGDLEGVARGEIVADTTKARDASMGADGVMRDEAVKRAVATNLVTAKGRVARSPGVCLTAPTQGSVQSIGRDPLNPKTVRRRSDVSA